MTRRIVDLADIVGGGNGDGTGRYGACISPETGETKGKSIAMTQPIRQGNHAYHPVETLPFVDGAFIPDGSRKPVIVSSENHIFVNCPPTDNSYWIEITNDLAVVGQIVHTLNLGGLEYCTPERAGINMHANLGITFDLAAIRRAHSGYEITQLLTDAGVSQSVTSDRARASLWILVDGQVRFQVQGMVRGDHRSVEVDLAPNDRFLTLVSTDGGNGLGGSFAVFGEPVLWLESSTQ